MDGSQSEKPSLVAAAVTTSTTATDNDVSSDRAVSAKMQSGLQDIVVQTGVGLVVGGLAGIVLARSGSSGIRKGLAGLGAGIGLGSAWTRTSMDLEEMLQNAKTTSAAAPSSASDAAAAAAETGTNLPPSQ